ncbi:hypothetical protein BDN67DRAFT_986108 [Paxillus ammoniavirescens]|nr:hypothetical protein BDN67DRAFT_986108 [Paxillus ammoniavirescens]
MSTMLPSNELDTLTKMLQKTPLADSVINQMTVTLFDSDLSNIPQSEDEGVTVSKTNTTIRRRKKNNGHCKINPTANVRLTKITKAALEYAIYCKPHIGKSATSADKAGKYLDRDGEIMGEIHLSRGWFALGQEKHGEILPSSDIISGGTVFVKALKFLDVLQDLSIHINKAIELVNPAFFKALTKLC